MFYVAAQNSNAVAIFARDTTTGALVSLNGLAGCIDRMGMGDLCPRQRPEKSHHVE